MKRLFVFGCSYTAYSWPTWADLLSCEYDVYENWAMSGLGNRAIAERICECHAKNNFNENDTIIVQWSTHLRNDFFNQAGSLEDRSPGWKTTGSVFNYVNSDIYDKKWFDLFFDEEAYFMHTLNHILMTQMFLEQTGATWYMTSIGDVRELGTDINIESAYNEQSIFFKLKHYFTNQKEKNFAYGITPALQVYNKPIWEDRANHWIEPIGSWIINNLKEPFYSFVDADDGPYMDYHPKTSLQQEWLINFLFPKLKINPNIEKYNKISNSCEKLYLALHDKNKKDFQTVLLQESFELPSWPNTVKGFTTLR
jgi:hypothetical protein